MATVVDDNVERQLKQAQQDYDSAVSRQEGRPGERRRAQVRAGHAGCPTSGWRTARYPK